MPFSQILPVCVFGAAQALCSALPSAEPGSGRNGSDTSTWPPHTQCQVAHFRDYFYTGGHYTRDGESGYVYAEQMYVERLQPATGVTQQFPLVLMHGQAQTGTNFLRKPDGGCGWAERFLQQGYVVYIIDQTLRGRSAWRPGAAAAAPSTYSAAIIEQRFTAPEKYRLWPQAARHTQWPGNGSVGDPVFDAFYRANVQFIDDAAYQQATDQAAGAALLDRIARPVVLVGHSQGGLLPLLIADARPRLTQALILLEPTGPPFREAVFGNGSARPFGLTDVPLTYAPPVTDPAVDLVKEETQPRPTMDKTACVLQAASPAPRTLINLASKPILTLTTEASYHAVYDYCTVQYLRQAGCEKATHLELAEVGVRGNGHMMFMEKNSDEILSLLLQWIKSV
ncbi:Alpha/beta hydrolase family-domain-containing protein [Xylariaceae sp. FL0016]|nr:Alpha/beta hydrolase family-domain-containing protein [Xylariaceae sp. FL0016]